MTSAAKDNLNNKNKFQCVLAILLAVFFFYLQSRYLHLAAAPYTDEGVYAEAGRLILKGFTPHKDFPIWHMPLLPVFIGVTLKLTGNMYFVRLIFLFLNCIAIVPLYLAFKKIQNNTGAAFLAILFYITFHEMVYHDFRFLAIRQLANDLFICFFYLGVCHKQWKWTPVIQSFLSVVSVLLFLPTAFNLFFLSLALILSEPTRAKQWKQLKQYILIGIPAVLALFLYFGLIPESLDQAVFGQLNRPASSRLARLKNILHRDKDIYFYLLSCIGLISAFLFHSKLRIYALAMIGVVITSIFLSSNFYPHYLSGAGPAFAFGIFSVGVLIYEHHRWKSKGRLIAFAIYIILFSFHLSVVFPSLSHEWQNNRKLNYYDMVEALSQTPEPLLAMEPIFAVDADKTMVQTPIEIYFHAPSPKKSFSIEEYKNMTAMACTILLENQAKGFFPTYLQKQWHEKFEVIKKNNLGKILVTNHPHCTTKLY